MFTTNIQSMSRRFQVFLSLVAVMWTSVSLAQMEPREEPYQFPMQMAPQTADRFSSKMIGWLPDLYGILNRPAVLDVIARAEDILERGLDWYIINSSYSVGGACLNDTESVLSAVVNRETWALRMIDAMGKPPSGLSDLHLTWLGSYDECVNVVANSLTTTPGPDVHHRAAFKGKYCKASFDIGHGSRIVPGGMALTVGLCLPASCDHGDAAGLASTLLSLVPVNTSILSPPTAVCQSDSLEYTTKAIAVTCVCALFGVIIVVGTVYDVLVICLANGVNTKIHAHVDKRTKYSLTTEPVSVDATPVCTKVSSRDTDTANKHSEPGRSNVENQYKSNVEPFKIDVGDVNSKKTDHQHGNLGKILLSFSLYTNGRKILDTRQSAATLTSLNGIRVIGMSWIILGHTFSFGLLTFEQNMVVFMPQMVHRITFQLIANGTFAVDTFFCLSGMLVAYLSLKEMKKVGGAKQFRWGMYYFHRFWRLTPPYMLILMTYVSTYKYWSNGPLWNQKGGEIDECKDSWWRNLLYINNLIEPADMCLGWSWYLANDMQFFVITPVLLVSLFYSRLWGGICCLVFILANFITSGVLSSVNHLSANVFLGVEHTAQFTQLYVKPWCRVGPYIVGIYTGYLLYATKCKVRLPKIVNVAGWSLASVLALLVIYGLYNPDGINPPLSNNVTALYNATSRTVWGVCVCWVVFSCATGHGGPVNALLSWRAFVPLSRLTYCAYLVHPMVMYAYYQSRRTLVHYTDLEIAFLFLGHACISYAVAFILSLTFEAPMMGIEKVLLGRRKRTLVD